jgi:hypothetical protein
MLPISNVAIANAQFSLAKLATLTIGNTYTLATFTFGSDLTGGGEYSRIIGVAAAWRGGRTLKEESRFKKCTRRTG